MTQREIEKRLKRYAVECEKIMPQEKEHRIELLLQLELPPCTRGTIRDFIMEQIGFLGKYCLFWQAAWLALFCYLVRYGMPYYFRIEDGSRILVVVSLLPPLLVLLTVEEITKVYQRSMLEIEYATKYSLRNVVVVRMLVLCVFHFMLVAAAIIGLHINLDSDIGKLCVYGFTPMVIETGILMKLMQRFEGEQLRGMSVGAYVLTVILVIIGGTEYFGWYRAECFRWWCIVCAAGMLLGIRQFVILSRQLEHFEQMIQDE